MQTDVYIKIINEKMNMEFWMAGFLVIPKVYAVIASPFRKKWLGFRNMQEKLEKKISMNGTTFFSDSKHQLLSKIQILLWTKGKSYHLTQHKIHLDDLARAYLLPLA